MSPKLNSSSSHRKQVSFTRKLAAYSIATGAGAFVSSDAYGANVDYSPPGAPVVLDITAEEVFTVDLNGDLIDDFVFETTDEYGPSLASIYPLAGNFVLPDVPFGFDVAVLSFSDTVGPDSSSWMSGEVSLALFDGIRGFVGVSFLDGAPDERFGYLEIKLDTTADTLTIYGGGYESDPGVAATAVPEPGCLGLLAAGAVGVLSWRGNRDRNG